MSTSNANRAAYVCNGASNHSDKNREQWDYYATEPNATKLFLDKLYLDTGSYLNQNVWEPACGENHITNVLKEYGHNVRTSDIIDRVGDGSIEIIDFLQQNEIWSGDIITNPPYKYATEFATKALETVTDNHKVVLFLKLTFLESKKRDILFQKYPFKYLYVSTKRLQCAMNGDFDTYNKGTGTAVAYGWYVWEKGFTGEPIIRWFNN